MIKEYEGCKYSIKVNHSNRFAFIAVYFWDNEYGREYPFFEDVAQRLESGEDVDTIAALYEHKRGSRCL
jgi:hypothetical protein